MIEQRLYLLGHPVGHSKSAVMYNAVYGEVGLPWRYELLDCPTEADARRVLEERAFLSVNITTPYKPLAFSEADFRMPSAVLADGANVLVNEGGKLAAHNTDGIGCVSFLQRSGFAMAGARVVVCGTGPTALSIMGACANAGAAGVFLLGRDSARSRATLEGWRARRQQLQDAGSVDALGTHIVAGSYEQAKEAGWLADAQLVVNATPLGMHEGDPAPFDTALLHEGQWVFDAVYGHGVTALVAAARAAGCVVFDGAGMLVMQAVETVRILEAAAQVQIGASNDQLFRLMAKAADFPLA